MDPVKMNPPPRRFEMDPNTTSLREALLSASLELREQVNRLKFGDPTAQVYNPLDYAWEPYADYVRQYARPSAQVVFVGMNPGPWGMAQVGVPFGEVGAVRDWLAVKGAVTRPAIEHPKRPIEGFACERSEVSGRRLWGLFQERFGTPSSFFANHFVLNYCPLVFMESSGRNRTPDKLSADERDPLYAACDAHLRRVVALLQPQWVIGVGKFAATRAREAGIESGVQVDWILHPSPASPAANRDWAGCVQRKLIEIGIWK